MKLEHAKKLVRGAEVKVNYMGQTALGMVVKTAHKPGRDEPMTPSGLQWHVYSPVMRGIMVCDHEEMTPTGKIHT
jgi:uncharacterized protein (DUF2236 family)